MKKNIKAIYFSEIALLILTIVFCVLTKVVSSNLKSYLAIIFLLMILIPNIVYFGFSNRDSYYSGYIIRVILTVLMACGIIIYLLGLILGFTRGFHFSLSTLGNTIIPIIVTVVITEMLRYNVVKYSYENHFHIILFTGLLAIFHILLETNFGTLDSPYHIFVYVCTIVLPVIADHFLCSYLVRKSSIHSSILFQLVVHLYMYVLPIIPNLGYYLYSVMRLLVPYLIFYTIHKNLLQDESRKAFIRVSSRIYVIPILLVSFVLIILVSGIFHYRLVAIATDSMKSTFYRGDAVLIEYDKAENIQVGDIMAFRHNQILVTHRVVRIDEKDGHYYFRTKGDSNNAEDAFTTSEKDVVGKVRYVVKYIGYPTVWTKELIERGS